MWPAYVINLAENTARMENSAAQLSADGIAYERIEAVNGWRLDAQEIAAVYDADANSRRGRHPLVPAEIGCYLSHVAAWRRIASGEAPGGFVFEDDFRADETLRETLQLLSRDADDGNGDWDMVKLFSFDPDPKTVDERPLGDKHRLVTPYRVPSCLIAYGLTRQAAARLAKQSIPFFRPVDEDQKFLWETGMRVALVLPTPVVVGDQQAESGTVGEARRTAANETGTGRLFRGVRGLLYQLRYRRSLRRHWSGKRSQ